MHGRQRRSVCSTATHDRGYASSHDCRVDCDQQTAEDACRRSGGSVASGVRLPDRVARQEAGGRLCAVRAARQDPAPSQTECGPGSPGSRPGGLGPHLASSGFSRRAFLRLPVCPPGAPPSSAFPWFPLVRRPPVRSLRPLPGSGSPSVTLRVPFPLSNLHASAAAERFRRRRSRAAGTKVISPAATSRQIARSARTAGGQRLGTMGCRHRITDLRGSRRLRRFR